MMTAAEQKPILEKRPASVSITRRRYIVIPVVLLYYLGSTMFKHVLDVWVEDTLKRQHFHNETIKHLQVSCRESNISSLNFTNISDVANSNYDELKHMKTTWLRYYKFAMFIPSLFATLILPSYTDVYGRSFFLSVNIFALCVRMCVESIIIFCDLDLFYGLIANGLEGLTGSEFSFSAVCFAYVADITPKIHRTFGIISLEFLVLISSIFSSKLASLLIEHIHEGVKYTAILCAVIVVLSFLTSLLLPEIRQPSRLHQTLSPLTAVKQTLSFYFSRNTQEPNHSVHNKDSNAKEEQHPSTNIYDFKGQRRHYIVLLLVFLFTDLSYYHRLLLEKLFFEDNPFCWKASKIEYYSIVRKIAQGFMGYICVKPMSRFMSDIAITLVSLLSNMGSYFLEAYAKHSEVLYIVPIIAIFSFITIPIVRSMMSNFTPPGKQAAMFAGLALVEILAGMISTSEDQVYTLSESVETGFAFEMMGACVCLAFILVLVYSCIKPEVYIGKFHTEPKQRRYLLDDSDV